MFNLLYIGTTVLIINHETKPSAKPSRLVDIKSTKTKEKSIDG